MHNRLESLHIDLETKLIALRARWSSGLLLTWRLFGPCPEVFPNCHGVDIIQKLSILEDLVVHAVKHTKTVRKLQIL